MVECETALAPLMIIYIFGRHFGGLRIVLGKQFVVIGY